MSQNKRRDSVVNSSEDDKDEADGSEYHPTPRRQSRGRQGALAHQLARLDLNPQTPQRPQTRSLANPEPPGAPLGSQHQHLLRVRHDVKHVGPVVPAILLEFLARCEPNTKYHATLNDAARKARFHHIPWKVYPWENEVVDRHSLSELFVRAVIRYPHLIEEGAIASWDPLGEVQRRPQMPKLLVLEGDVADSVLLNVISPLSKIFDLFLRSEFKGRLQCTVRSQHSVKSSKLDHAIYLTEIIPAENKDYELKCPLVVIEEKRPGIVREQDWQNKPLHPHSSSKNWMGLLLPQLFLYAEHARCHRFFLTNYTTTIGVQIDLGDLDNAVEALDGNAQKRDVQVRTHSCTKELKEHTQDHHHPYAYGFRMALAFEVFMALSDLGVADYALLDKELARRHDYKVDPTITKHLKTAPLHARRDSRSPSSRLGHLEYSNPPPSP